MRRAGQRRQGGEPAVRGELDLIDGGAAADAAAAGRLGRREELGAARGCRDGGECQAVRAGGQVGDHGAGGSVIYGQVAEQVIARVAVDPQEIWRPGRGRAAGERDPCSRAAWASRAAVACHSDSDGHAGHRGSRGERRDEPDPGPPPVPPCSRCRTPRRADGARLAPASHFASCPLCYLGPQLRISRQAVNALSQQFLQVGSHDRPPDTDRGVFSASCQFAASSRSRAIPRETLDLTAPSEQPSMDAISASPSCTQ